MTREPTRRNGRDGIRRAEDVKGMDERVSLPLDPETALRALLRVDPDAPEADSRSERDAEE